MTRLRWLRRSTALKIRRKDAARVRAVREAVGDQVELMSTQNYLFSFPVALDLAKRIEPYGIRKSGNHNFWRKVDSG